MAQRTREKAKRPSGRVKEPSPSVTGLPERADARLKAVEKERDSLKSELDAAKQRIAALEESRNVVAQRIDWVIESLDGVVDKPG